MKASKAEAAAKVISGIARKSDFEVLGLEAVQALKRDSSIVHFRFADHAPQKDASDPEERTFVWRASTEHCDSMGDCILVAGWDVTRVKAGICPLLYGHDAEPLPFGLMMRANKSAKCEDGVPCLELTGRFHDADIYGDGEAGLKVEGARKLVARELMKTTSVGFVPLDGGMEWPKEDERKERGMPPWGAKFIAQELLELSLTPIPAQRNARRGKDIREALRQLVSEGEISEASADLFASELAVSEEGWLARVKELGRTVVPVTRDLHWLKGATQPAKEPPVEAADVVKAIEKAAVQAIAMIQREAAAAVRRECSAVIRETLGGIEDSIVEAADRIEDALGTKRATTSERAEGSTPSEPQGSDADPAASTGTSRESPTNPTPAPSLARGLMRAIAAADSRTDTANADSRPGQEGGLQER